MRNAQCDDEDNNNVASHQVFDGLGDHGHSLAPSLDKEDQASVDEDQALEYPLDEDPDALLFKETFAEGTSIVIKVVQLITICMFR
jgi:hypothetical protein